MYRVYQKHTRIFTRVVLFDSLLTLNENFTFHKILNIGRNSSAGKNLIKIWYPQSLLYGETLKKVNSSKRVCLTSEHYSIFEFKSSQLLFPGMVDIHLMHIRILRIFIIIVVLLT